MRNFLMVIPPFYKTRFYSLWSRLLQHTHDQEAHTAVSLQTGGQDQDIVAEFRLALLVQLEEHFLVAVYAVEEIVELILIGKIVVIEDMVVGILRAGKDLILHRRILCIPAWCPACRS